MPVSCSGGKTGGYTDSLSSYARPAYTGKTMEIPYRETVAVPDSLNEGRILAVVTTDGCGICSAIDTLVMADISNPVTLIEPKAALKVDWIVPEFVVRPKIMQARGEARLQFAINSSDIRMDLANNKVEMEQMLDKLKQIAGRHPGYPQFGEHRWVCPPSTSLCTEQPSGKGTCGICTEMAVCKRQSFADTATYIQRRFTPPKDGNRASGHDSRRSS